MTTLKKAVEGFTLAKQAEGRSWHTIADYRVHLERFAAHTNGTPIEEITPHDVNAFLAWYRADFRITHRGVQEIEPRKLSAKTIRNAWASLSSFWTWACEEFGIEDSPFRVPCPKAKTKPIEPLEQEEVERLLAFCNVRNKALVLALLDTGCRVSELCAVDISDLDLQRGQMFLRTTKGDKPRVVFIGSATKKAIWTYIRKRGEGSGPLFLSRTGDRLTRNAIRLTLGRIGKRAGVPNAHPHRLRHTAALELLRNGCSVFHLQKILGHSQLSTTQKYLRLLDGDLAEAHKQAAPADVWRLK